MNEGTLIKDFRAVATPEQLKVIDSLVEMGKKEKELVAKVNEAHRPFQEMARREHDFWGPSTDISNMVIDQEIYPLGCEAARPYQKRLERHRTEMAKAFLDAAKNHGLGHLRYVKLTYKNLAGKPLPEKYIPQTKNP